MQGCSEPDLSNGTCLFIGEALTRQTHEEHTLLRAMGGRIRSRVVSCDKFNHRAGETVDRTLALVYAIHMNVLAPLLSTEHQPGLLAVSVPGDCPGLVLEHGALTLRNLAILSRDENGRPNRVMAPAVEASKRIARQLGMGKNVEISFAPASQSSSFQLDCPTIRPAIEVAALKACLLTFDHLLQDNPNRFTRSTALVEVRRFIQKAVMDEDVDTSMCHRFSLGMQYDRLPLYRQMRRSIPFDETPFEHVLLVAGYAPERCIDIVWIVLGFDPFGFRVAHDWNGGSFAFGVVNGVMKGGGFSPAVPLVAPDTLLCHPTNLRSCNEEPVEANVQEINSRRLAAKAEAAYLVEMKAPDALQYNFVQNALCGPPSQRKIGAQILNRLQSFYGRTPDLKRAVINVFRSNLRGELKQVLQEYIVDGSESAVNWPICLRIYQACLADLRSRFGLPSGDFVQETRTDSTSGTS